MWRKFSYEFSQVFIGVVREDARVVANRSSRNIACWNMIDTEAHETLEAVLVEDCLALA